MLDQALSSQQLAVICALSSGATLTNAAQQAGVHRNTVANWHRNLLPFRDALAGAQYDKALFFREKAEELVDLAFQTVRGILTDPKTPASVRLKAALAIIGTASAPPPPPIGQPVAHNDAQSDLSENSVPTDPSPAGPAAQPAPHNPAQPAPRSECPKAGQPKIGRNEMCPCGSGQKYKRCCLNKPASQPLAAAA